MTLEEALLVDLTDCSCPCHKGENHHGKIPCCAHCEICGRYISFVAFQEHMSSHQVEQESKKPSQ